LGHPPDPDEQRIDGQGREARRRRLGPEQVEEVDVLLEIGHGVERLGIRESVLDENAGSGPVDLDPDLVILPFPRILDVVADDVIVSGQVLDVPGDRRGVVDVGEIAPPGGRREVLSECSVEYLNSAEGPSSSPGY
jgi:hypothetical protein